MRTFSTSSRARGARRAGAGRRSWKRYAPSPPPATRRRTVRHQVAVTGGTVTRRAPPADLRPSGPRRRRRALSPRGRPHEQPARRGQRWRASCPRWPPLRRPILKPCVLTVKGAPGGASRAIPSGPWTAPPQGFSGAYRRDGLDRAPSEPTTSSQVRCPQPVMADVLRLRTR